MTNFNPSYYDKNRLDLEFEQITETEHLGFISEIETFEERKNDFPITEGPYKPEWNSISSHKTPSWWEEAKFGIFLHWGPQAAGKSGDWYARTIYDENDNARTNHLKNYGHPSQVGYKEVLHTWNPDKWNADKIVEAYRDAGFKYALVVGVHHDNYDLWNSKYQQWNSVNVGPKVDFLAAWKKALAKANMRFGVSFHHEYTWWWWQQAFGADTKGDHAGVTYDGNLSAADGKGKWWEGLDPKRLYGIPMPYKNLSEGGAPYLIHDIPFGRKGIFGEHLAYAKWYSTQWALRIQDVVDNYDPDFFYTDGNGEFPFCGWNSGAGYKCDAAARITAHFYNRANTLGKENEKLAVIKFNEKCPGVATTFEGNFAENIKTDQPWMADMAVGDWFYRPGFHYDARMVLHALLEHISRGGNLTLCVSLTPEGEIDEGSATMMKQMGAWLRIYGKGIYGSKAWKVWGESSGEKITLSPGGKLGIANAEFQFENGDYRFTVSKDGKICVWLLKIPTPGEQIKIKSLGKNCNLLSKDVSAVTLLSNGNILKWQREGDALIVTYPEIEPYCHGVSCICVE